MSNGLISYGGTGTETSVLLITLMFGVQGTEL